MLRSSYKIATVWGIPIKIHMSLILLLAFFCLSALRTGIKEGNALLHVAGVALSLVGAFVSIALHELGHSYVAIKKGCRVRQITLMFIGGAAQMEEIPRKPLDEFQMAVAGPLVSLALGTVGFFGGRYLAFREDSIFHLVGILIWYLGMLNFFWAGFNLLPSFPMDGGRVLRAMLTPKLGRLRATMIAARLGKILAVLFGIYGFATHQWILVAIAFFIFSAAGSELRLVQLQEAARQQGFDIWPPFPGYGPRRTDDDEVRISPPPYRRGPDSRSEIHPDQ